MSLKKAGRTVDNYGHLVQRNGNVIFADEVPPKITNLSKFNSQQV